MDTPDYTDILQKILLALQDIATALKNPAVDTDLQNLVRVLGQIAQNGTTP